MPLFIFSSERRRTAAVIAVLVAVFGLCDAVLVIVFHGDTFQTLAVKALTPEKEVLILGSSRVHFGVDTRLLTRPSVALPANYENLVYGETLLHLHQGKLPGLKALVLEVDVATLAFDTDQLNPYGTLDLGISRWSAPTEWARHFDRSLHRALAPEFSWRLTPGFLSLWRVRTIEGLEPLAVAAGHIPSRISVPFPELSADTEVKSTLATIAEAPPGTVTANEKALIRIVDGARAAGLKTLLLRFPLEPALRSRYPKHWDEIVFGALTTLWANGGRDGVGFLDLSRDERFVTAEFRDSDHLNQKGAEALAAILNPALDGLLK